MGQNTPLNAIVINFLRRDLKRRTMVAIDGMCEAVAREQYDDIDFETEIWIGLKGERIEMAQIPSVAAKADQRETVARRYYVAMLEEVEAVR